MTESAASRTSREPVPPLLRLAALAFLLVAVVAPTPADPDLWGHVVFGRDIVLARALHTADPYSFTSDRPWINHEWLAEVLMYLSWRAGGAAGLVYLKAIVVCGTLACVVAVLRRRHLRAIVHDLLIVVALAGTFTRYHPVRPQLFSLLLFALLLLAIASAEGGDRRRLPWVPLIFAAWANLHGGFLVGLGILASWAAVQVARKPRTLPAMLALLAASIGATLLTPYGIGLWRFLWETVGTSRPEIADWRSALTAGPLVLIPWIVVVATAGYALWRSRRAGVPVSAVVIVGVLTLASLRVGRLDAFLALSVVMLLGPLFGEPREEALPTRRWGLAPRAGALVLAAAAAIGMGRRGSCIEMRDYPEPEATAFLQPRAGRVLTVFGWGQYAIWHLAPQLRVSMDGRRETVYSDALLQAHLRLYRGEPGSTSLVRDLAPDFVWLHANSPGVALLGREGWQTVFRGPLSVILARRPGGPAQTVEPPPPQPRCFPDR
jgi:hypothetical protein